MKYFKVLLASLTLISAGSAFAVPISVVGNYDSLIAQTSLSPSGSGAEEAWIEGTLGEDITYLQFGDESAGESGNWEAVEGGVAGDYAFFLGQAWEYVLVNVGGGRGTGTEDTHYLLRNNPSTDYVFLNLSIFGPDVSLTNVGVISHVGAAVPIPGAALLFLTGLGLFGIGFKRRQPAH